MAAEPARAQARAPFGARAPRTRAWVFTINNPDLSTEASLERAYADGGIMYLVWGRETAPTTGTPHLQGYVYFANPVSLGGCKLKLVGASGHAHLEQARGTPAEASAYCKKDGDHQELGKLPRQGRRTDLARMFKAMKSGSRVIDLLESGDLSGPQALATAERLSAYIPPRERPDVKAIWLWGDTGLGKTRFYHDMVAHHGIDPADAALCSLISRQIDYKGQRCVLFDEADGMDRWWLSFFLRFLDRYPLSIRVLYGHQAVCAVRCVITSHQDPERLLEAMECSSRWPELSRRLLDVVEVTSHFWGSPHHVALRRAMALPEQPALPPPSHPPLPSSGAPAASGPTSSSQPLHSLDGLSPTTFSPTSTARLPTTVPTMEPTN